MKIGRFTAFVGIAAIVLAAAAPGFAEQTGASCSQDIAQARAHIWRAQAAMDIAHHPFTGEPTSGTSRALASAEFPPKQGDISAGRVPGMDQPKETLTGSGASRKPLASAEFPPKQGDISAGRVPGMDQPKETLTGSGASRKPLASAEFPPKQGDISAGRVPGMDQPKDTLTGSGAGRALAAAPGFTSSSGPTSGVARIASTANAQFRVLASDQDRKAFVGTLNEQERRLLYQTLSGSYKKRMASAVSDPKDISQKVSDQETKAWAEKIASDRAGLSKKVAKARTLVRAAQDFCKKGDSAGATAKAKEAMDVLK